MVQSAWDQVLGRSVALLSVAPCMSEDLTKSLARSSSEKHATAAARCKPIWLHQCRPPQMPYYNSFSDDVPPPLATGALTLLTEGVATSFLHAGTAVSLRSPLRSTCQESCFTQSPPCSTCRESCFPQTPRPIYMPGELFPSAPRLIYMPGELFPSGPPPRSTCRVGCFFYFLCFFYYAL